MAKRRTYAKKTAYGRRNTTANPTPPKSPTANRAASPRTLATIGAETGVASGVDDRPQDPGYTENVMRWEEAKRNKKRSRR